MGFQVIAPATVLHHRQKIPDRISGETAGAPGKPGEKS